MMPYIILYSILFVGLLGFLFKYNVIPTGVIKSCLFYTVIIAIVIAINSFGWFFIGILGMIAAVVFAFWCVYLILLFIYKILHQLFK